MVGQYPYGAQPMGFQYPAQPGFPFPAVMGYGPYGGVGMSQGALGMSQGTSGGRKRSFQFLFFFVKKKIKHQLSQGQIESRHLRKTRIANSYETM